MMTNNICCWNIFVESNDLEVVAFLVTVVVIAITNMDDHVSNFSHGNKVKRVFSIWTFDFSFRNIFFFFCYWIGVLNTKCYAKDDLFNKSSFIESKHNSYCYTSSFCCCFVFHCVDFVFVLLLKLIATSHHILDNMSNQQQQNVFFSFWFQHHLLPSLNLNKSICFTNISANYKKKKEWNNSRRHNLMRVIVISYL